jgi:PAX-interacting protein 1
MFRTMLERIITFLQVPKSSILPNFKEKLGSYERQILNFINTNKPRKPVSSLQQGQTGHANGGDWQEEVYQKVI